VPTFVHNYRIKLL